MLISHMKPGECGQLLARLGAGRLGCGRDKQPYVLPIYFAYEPDHLYGFATLGQKIEWMRINPMVCVQADEVLGFNRWASVVVNGRYEELPETPEHADKRKHAQSSLERRYLWWQTGYAAYQVRSQRHPTPILYCIHIEQMTGLQASPDQEEIVITAGFG